MITAFLITSCVCAGIAFCFVPVECWRTVRLNCRRLDGSFSTERCFREVAAFLDYLGTIAVPALLAFLILIVATTLLFSWVMPLDLVGRSFENFEWDADVWRENLSDVRTEHTSFLHSAGFGSDQIKLIQQQLWHGWPIIGIVFVVVIWLSFRAFLRCACRSVVLLVRGIRARRRLYAADDVREMMIGDDARPTLPGDSTAQIPETSLSSIDAQCRLFTGQQPTSNTAMRSCLEVVKQLNSLSCCDLPISSVHFCVDICHAKDSLNRH